MFELDYSDDAKNVLNKFYNVDFIIYVEGQNDIPFWEYLFKKFTSITFEIKDLGGVLEIKKHIDKIVNGEVNGIVACDADFSYTGEFPSHSNIIRSYGYSIENSLICVESIKKSVKSLGKSSEQLINSIEIQDWFNEIKLVTHSLVIHDIANDWLGCGKKVTGENCSRFLVSQNSRQLNSNKIDNHLKELNLPVDQDLEKNILESLSNNGRMVFDFLRGHFLFSAVLKLLVSIFSQAGKKISLSKDAFFGMLMLSFETVFDSNHLHYHYYSKSLGSIKNIA